MNDAASSSAPASPAEKSTTSVLDIKRDTNVAIMLRGFAQNGIVGGVEKIVKAITECNGKVLSIEHMRSILGSLPTSNEVQKLQEKVANGDEKKAIEEMTSA